MSEFYEARIRAEWPDWTFGAHQAAARAAAAEQLVALRRRYPDLPEEDLAALAVSWRPDSVSGPYFAFTAAPADRAADGTDRHNGGEPGLVAVSAVFVKALLLELAGEAPAALAALLDRWAEQRRNSYLAGGRAVPARSPRVVLLLPRDESRWPALSWAGLSALDLQAPEFDGALLRWDAGCSLWLAVPLP
ncbi:hypothetical protein KGA66_16950 [Actinocrinis puniceicyclus]|uniref:Uncharacterized protein n=1 Tax=Actinocrinis puniceicyclus TaxID=977794 RepID=A0A8J8BFH3_9ACTN|nr:hypothetical protein [Actinocrinis puniceicyclus]MBS2964749.1 hypothetical protein [Actinocrinis puniceicyclus]